MNYVGCKVWLLKNGVELDKMFYMNYVGCKGKIAGLAQASTLRFI